MKLENQSELKFFENGKVWNKSMFHKVIKYRIVIQVPEFKQKILQI